MSGRTRKATKRDVTAAIAAAMKAGLAIRRVEIIKDKIVIVAGNPGEDADEIPAKNEWDDAEL